MGRLRLAGLAFCLALAAAGSSLAGTAGSGAHSNVSPPSCPVTAPNNVAPPGNGPKARGYQHGGLWVVLWPYGVTLVGKDDVTAGGWLGVKVPWYRYGKGKLTITATRIGKPASRPIRTHIPFGYGLTGFQSSFIYFPSEGCWKVVGTAGHAQLAFVTIVLKTQTVRQ
jgi:hypothetical protein